MLEKRKKTVGITHAQIMALGFFLVIATGTLLLMLPISSRTGEWTNWLDCLFTATSATCVTGLVVKETFQYWSVFGQVVIIALIQIGGLGVITLTVLVSLFLKRRIGIKTRNLIQESVSSMQLSGVVKLVRKIVKGTILFEGIGAILLSTQFVPKMGWAAGIWNGVFHSISAFCNAGFDLMGRYQEYSSLTLWYDNTIVNFTIMGLIVIGGLGFIVWDDIYRNRLHFKKYSLHSKVVILMTTGLIFGGAFLFILFEHTNLFAGMTPWNEFMAAMFASVTPRTAGFNTTDLATMTQPGKLLTCLLMFIGGSPGSTAGGVKTTTMVVMIAYIWSNLTNSSGCNIMQRRISDENIKTASMVIGLNLTLITLALVVISACQVFPMDDLMLEVFSAMGTVGLSAGITRSLLAVPKLMLILLMYSGRIGTITFAVSLAFKKKSAPVQFPVEQINVG